MVETFQVTLIVATFLCTLVAGFVFAFAVVVMPGLLVYLLGVQLPTAVINIPLNNRVQTLAIADMDGTAREEARREFESRWNHSNSARTVVACLVSIVLIVLLLRL